VATTEQIRNVVLLGHNGSGKTSLAEAMLHEAQVTSRQGTVERGDTVMDHDPEERALGQSISLAVASFDWQGHRINLIDTPGYADFRGEAILGLAAADLAVFVIDGVAGVQSQDVALWRLASSMAIPRLVFVNKLDRERSSFDRTLAQVREVFSSHADPAELPIGEESGSLDAMLGKVAGFYEEEVDNAVDSLSSLLEPLIMVVLGVLIGGLVIAMYLPIFMLGQVI